MTRHGSQERLRNLLGQRYFVHRSELEGMADTDPDEGYVALVDADLLAASEERERELEAHTNRMVAERTEALAALSSHREALRDLIDAVQSEMDCDEVGRIWFRDDPGPTVGRLWSAVVKARALLSDQPKEEGTTEG